MKLLLAFLAGNIIYAVFLGFLIAQNVAWAKSSNGWDRAKFVLNVVLIAATIIPFSVFMVFYFDPEMQAGPIIKYSWIAGLTVGTAITVITHFRDD